MSFADTPSKIAMRLDPEFRLLICEASPIEGNLNWAIYTVEMGIPLATFATKEDALVFARAVSGLARVSCGVAIPVECEP